MTIQIDSGTRLGSYEIVSRIGAGGMGEVWRARDSQIGRDVAIKVLPVSVAENADRLHRFELEARAAGTLNHPNLVTIFELGKHDGAPFIVMELLEGETLREKIDQGTIPPRKAVEYSVQMANGLAAAHEKGIVHRDLKPENVIVTADGRLKILDFGLAKLTTPEQTADDKTARRDTAPGTVMGTAGYMSPEQVRGLQIDHRTDIFSFGAILYEMVSGRQAFKRDSSVETMNAILKEDPPEMSVSGHHGSPATERIIHRCLEKNAAERFQSARDLSFALESLSSSSSGHESAILAAPAPSNRKRFMALGAIAAAALMALFFFVGRSSRPQSGQPTVRQLTFRNGTVRSARFAPDGQTIVYGAAWDGAPLKMFQRRLEGSESVPLEFPDADLLGISSKGELAISLGRTFRNWITTGNLAKAPLLGSSYRKVLDGVSWADWNPGGDGLLVVRRVGNEDRLEYPIGKVLYRTAGFITYPRFSPKGDRVAFLDHPIYGDNRGNVSVLTIGGKKTDLLLDWSGLEGLAWAPSGDEVWFTGSPVNGGWSIYAVHERGRAPHHLAHSIQPDPARCRSSGKSARSQRRHCQHHSRPRKGRAAGTGPVVWRMVGRARYIDGRKECTSRQLRWRRRPLLRHLPAPLERRTPDPPRGRGTARVLARREVGSGFHPQRGAETVSLWNRVGVEPGHRESLVCRRDRGLVPGRSPAAAARVGEAGVDRLVHSGD
ncbi:MAG: serine/threonine-protein kinase [Thermoanaerobaculia bacterium]